MIIVTITVKAAFHDCQVSNEDNIADTLASEVVRYLLDGQDAEVCYTTQRTARHVDVADPEFDDWAAGGYDQFDAWQARAREEMDRVTT